MLNMIPYHEMYKMPKDANFRISRAGFFEFSAHWQDEIEIIHILDGVAEVQIDGSIYAVSQGQTLFVNPGEIHRYISPKSSVEFILLIFRPSMLLHQLPYFEGKRICSHCTSSMEAANTIISLFDCFNVKQIGWELEAYGKMHLIAAFMARELQWEKMDVYKEKQRLIRLSMLKRVLKYTQENFGESIALKDAANAIGYSMYHFARLFKQSMGTTYMEYLADIRLQNAENMLMQTSVSITEIAHECGFDNVKTFNRLFKSRRGCSPSIFRKSKI